jgi:hypothetical protein
MWTATERGECRGEWGKSICWPRLTTHSTGARKALSFECLAPAKVQLPSKAHRQNQTNKKAGERLNPPALK